MFKQIPLRVKLGVAFLLMTVMVAAVGIYQVRSINQMGGLFSDLTGNDFERVRILNEMKITVKEAEITAFRYGQGAPDAIAAGGQSGTAEIDAYTKKVNDLLRQYKERLEDDAEYAAEGTAGRELQQSAQNVMTAATAYLSGFTTQQSVSQQTANWLALEKAETAFDQKVADVMRSETILTRAENAAINDTVSRLSSIILLLIVGVALFSLLLGVLGIKMITGAFHQLKQGAQRVANGDFSKRIPVIVHDEAGQVAAAFNDMTDRLRESYRRLSVETERDRILLENLGEGVVAVDEKAKIVLVNSQAIAMLELADQSKLIGQPVHRTVALLDTKGRALPGSAMPIVQALKLSKPLHDIYSYHKQAGAKIMIDVIANPILVGEEPVGAIMNLRDVTKEREIDRMKTEFISLASHQLRTPLSAIKWFSEMLISGDAGKLKPDQEEFAHNIADSTERMIALVNALLNISRIESGRIMVEPKPTDLNELVSGIVNDLKAKTEDKQQTLIISVHQDLPKIKLDPRLIGQVYLNLLTNAIKYTQKGGEISVFISKKDDQVISQVTDNGYGIPKEQQGRIFQKFFRAANAVKVETDGTGLGLYLIKAVIESSGGKIWFESEEGKGTTFWFSIPLSGMKAKEGEVTLDV